jgi:hypothetical protein
MLISYTYCVATLYTAHRCAGNSAVLLLSTAVLLKHSPVTLYIPVFIRYRCVLETILGIVRGSWHHATQ